MKARGRNGAAIIRDFRKSRNTCAIHGMTFIHLDVPGLTAKQAKALEKVQRERFESWWDSWISPLIDEVESRVDKTKKAGAK